MTVYNLIEISKNWNFDSMGIFTTIEKAEAAIQYYIKDNFEYYGGPNNPDFTTIKEYRIYVAIVDPELTDEGMLMCQKWLYSYDKMTGLRIEHKEAPYESPAEWYAKQMEMRKDDSLHDK